MVLQKRTDLIGALVNTVHQESGAPVLDLLPYPAASTGNSGSALPEGLGHGKAEPFPAWVELAPAQVSG